MSTNNQNSQERGFTLVELSIVLVVIGLIIGGVLKGQEMIRSAQLKDTIAFMQSIQSAYQIFRDTYGGLPGDYVDANERLGAPLGISWAGCEPAGSLCNGNSHIDQYNAGEALLFWQHLVAANLITGVPLDANPSGTAGFLPSLPVGGVVSIWDNTDSNGLRFGLWGELATTNAGGQRIEGPLSASELRQLDKAHDDGHPGTGWIISIAPHCHTNASGHAATVSSAYILDEDRCRAGFKIN